MNLYTYCGNNPIIFTDPLGHDYYYFFGNHIDEDGNGGDDNSGQEESAIINKAELEENGEVVHMYEISSSDDFQNKWKNINPTKDDSIIINFHGDQNSVKYMNLDAMDKKNAGYVYLFACNAADQKVKNNFAERFFNANSFSCMIACDGTNYRQTVTVPHHKWWDIANLFDKTQYYVKLSVVKNNVDIGPSEFSMGYVAYTKDAESSDKNSIGSIGNRFNGITKLIEAAHKYHENLK